MENKELYIIAEQKHPDVKGEYDPDNISCIDTEKLLAHVLWNHAEISRDPDFLRKVIKDLTTPAQDQKYKLYEGIKDWLEEIKILLPTEIQNQAEIANVTEQDCAEWLRYIINKYDLTGDDEFLDGLALVMRTDPDGWVTEDYRL